LASGVCGLGICSEKITMQCNPKERDNLEDIGVDGRIILNVFFKETGC
jgi:hypothetical protein